MQFAELLVDRGKAQESLELSEQALKIWSATSTDSSPYTAQAHAIHAYALAHLGRSGDSSRELAAALPALIKTQGADDAFVRRAQGWLKQALPQTLQTASTSR